MTKFFSGPAHGQVLSLASAPRLLRVTRTADGKIDALNAPDDSPRQDETITVYRLKEQNGGCFIDGRDPKTGKRFGRFETMAQYVLHDTQPADEVMRDNVKWRQWCTENEGGKE